MASFAGKRILLTGAAGGIGRALAHRFGRDGARLVLLDLDAARLQALAAELDAAGISALPLQCDLATRDSCETVVRQAARELDGLDVLINNAGITHLSPFVETDVDVIRRVMEVNFFGAVHCTKAALPFLIERRGQIVVLSSFAGLAPLATRSGYAASKHALNGFFGSLGAELVHTGVGVTLVCPTFVKTAIGDHALGGDGGRPTQARTEAGTPVEPERLAEAIYRAACVRKRLLVPFRDAKLSWALARFFPRAYERIMLQRIAPGERA